MVSVSVVSVFEEFKRRGRKPKLPPEKLLEAIREYASTEPSLLGEKLGVNRSTIWRCMQRIPKEEIETTLREIAELELKPAETDYNVFIQISEVADYKEKLDAKKRSKTYKSRVLHGLFRACVYLKKHPAKLTVEESAELLKDTALGRTPFESVGELKKALRSWFLRKGISAQFLTAKGVEADKPKHDKERAHTRLTPKHRQKFMRSLEKNSEH